MNFKTIITSTCYFSTYIYVLIIIFLHNFVLAEPTCSKFHYEEQTLKKMIRLEFRMEMITSEFEETQKRTQEMLEELKVFQEKLSAEFNDIKEQNRRDMESRFEDVKVLKDSVSVPAIAFQARSPATLNPKSEEKIVFTITLHDSTESYNNETGIFTAPYAGTYLFNVQICLGLGDKYIHYAILVRSKAVTNTLLYDTESRFCNSATAIVDLQKDDHVYVKVTNANQNAIREAEYEWNVFSGVLINIT